MSGRRHAILLPSEIGGSASPPAEAVLPPKPPAIGGDWRRFVRCLLLGEEPFEVGSAREDGRVAGLEWALDDGKRAPVGGLRLPETAGRVVEKAEVVQVVARSGCSPLKASSFTANARWYHVSASSRRPRR